MAIYNETLSCYIIFSTCKSHVIQPYITKHNALSLKICHDNLNDLKIKNTL